MNKFNLSTIEQDFILKAISERKRLDGREAFQFRDLAINFGVERGCCIVDLGNTKVMAQVSCEVSAPKESRPTEGILFVNVELSSMAAPYFDSSRPSDASAHVNRFLERCLKESGCVDLESLCIQAGMKVWVIRVDLHVLNNDGNMVDALCVAAVSALSHFRRPDVIVSGEDATIIGAEERDPLPLTLHHLPICVTFAFFDSGKYILIDPTEKEERVMEGTLVICMNRHKEVCVMQSTGSARLLHEQIARCKDICFINVTAITEKIVYELQKTSGARPAVENVMRVPEIIPAKKQKKPDVIVEPVMIPEPVEAKMDESPVQEVQMVSDEALDSDVDEDLGLLTKSEGLTPKRSSDNVAVSVSPKKPKKQKKSKKEKKQ